MMNGHTIGITGLGIVCSIGNDADAVLDSLRQGRAGIRQMRYLNSKHIELPVGEVQLSNDQMKEILGITDSMPMSRTALMGAIAIRQALRQAGIQVDGGKRVVLISGTTVGGMDLAEDCFGQMLANDAPLYLPQGNECGKNTLEMAKLAGLSDIETCTISTACSSALNSIIVGSEMLQHDEADIVIAGGSEALSRFHLNGFNTLMILDKEPCRPFDDTRAGLNLGEGAAFVVLEKDAPDSLAYVAGYGNRCDAFHQTASSENGEGAYLAMKDALDMARLKPDAIQYVNAHGTGTPNNDLSESKALWRLFGDKLPEVSSTKSFTGHTTSASGSIETVISVLALRHQFTPANLGWKHPMIDGIVPTMGHEEARLEHVMCNSFGFGGNDSSLIISRTKPVPDRLVAKQDYTFRLVAGETITSVDALGGLREFVSPMESRRMGKLMRSALLVSLRALKSAGIACPDAIVTATSRGMFEISMQFLKDLVTGNEEHLKPTLFMQSTHNTLGAAIAIRTKCYGYNITYSHGEDSFKWAMKDAERLLQTGKAHSVLVGSFDESAEIDAKALVLIRN